MLYLKSAQYSPTTKILYHTSNPSPLLISQKLQIQQCTTSAGPATEHLLPPGLLLVAMRKGDVYMFERKVVFGEFLEAEDVCIFGCVFDP